MIRAITACLILILFCAFANAKESKTFNLTTEILSGNLEGLSDMLKAADYGDTIEIYIDSPGGSVNETMKILDEMSASKAKTSCTVGRVAASGAAVIMLQCDDVTLSPKSLILFHMPFYVVTGLNFEEHAIHDGFFNEEFANFINSRYCFEDAVGKTVYRKFLMGQDIVFEKEAAEDLLQKTCRIHNSLLVVGKK